MGILVALSTFAGGCAATSPEKPMSPTATWLAGQGGIVSGEMTRHATRIGASLASETFQNHVTVQVLAADVPCGYAWPDGSIFITRGLMKIADDDELAAAIAHEMGHLLADGGPPSLVALAGHSACNEGCESRADAMGCLLLRVKGRPTSAMSTLLQKVECSALTDPAARADIARRVAILHDAGAR